MDGIYSGQKSNKHDIFINNDNYIIFSAISSRWFTLRYVASIISNFIHLSLQRQQEENIEIR